MLERDRPFRVAEAVREGVSRETLRSAAWERPFHGVRAPAGSLFDVDRLCAAYATKMPPGSLFCGITAALLWRMPLPAYLENDRKVHVAARAPRRAAQGVGVVGSQYDGSTVSSATVLGLRVFAPVDARLTREDFESALAKRRSGRGIGSLRWALQRAQPGSLSRTETLTRVVLRSAGIPAPSLNHRIVRAGRTFHVDLAWPEVRFGLEYDGDHHRQPEQFLDDISRQELIQDDAWLLMRTTRRELFGRPEQLCERVARRLSERGWGGIRLDMRHLVRPRP